MTRSKGWLHLSGLHSGSRAAFYDEINRCLSDIRERGLIEFVYGPPKWDPSDELADEVMWKQSKLGDF
jgi:hypothetical protein